jgi:hypothetical protein
MSTVKDEIYAATGRIENVLTLYAEGWNDAGAKQEIEHETALIAERMPFVTEMLSRIEFWGDILYNPRKWNSYTVNQGKAFIRADCASIRSAALHLPAE